MSVGCSAGAPAVFYPSSQAPVVDPTPQSTVICYYDPVSGAVFPAAVPGLPAGYDVANSAYLYAGGGGGGLPVVPPGGYGLPGRAAAAHSALTMLTQQQQLQPHYVQRLA